MSTKKAPASLADVLGMEQKYIDLLKVAAESIGFSSAEDLLKHMIYVRTNDYNPNPVIQKDPEIKGHSDKQKEIDQRISDAIRRIHSLWLTRQSKEKGQGHDKPFDDFISLARIISESRVPKQSAIASLSRLGLYEPFRKGSQTSFRELADSLKILEV